MKIDRTLFWFGDKSDNLVDYDDQFFPLAILLNRLLNEVYKGKKMKFININFFTEETYELFPELRKNEAICLKGNLTFNGTIDFASFDNLSEQNQKKFIWDNALKYFEISAKSMKNTDFLEAANYAYKKGIEINFNPNFIVVESEEVIIKDQKLKGSIWMHFIKEGMYSRFTLEKDEKLVLERELDNCKHGVEFFLEIYKKIEIKDKNVIIKGHRDVDYLPLKIPIPQV